MIRAAQYDYINARIRALMSSLFTEMFFERLARAPSFEEGLFLFRPTDWRFIPDIYSRTGDMKMVEKATAGFLYNDLLRLRRHAPTVLWPLIDVLIDRIRYDAFKTALRLWFDQVYRKRSIAEYAEYVPRDIPLVGISADDIINAPTSEALLRRLTRTPYDVIRPGISRLAVDPSLLRAELILSDTWYRRLREVISRFRGEEQVRLHTIIAEEIDRINLERIIRVVPHLTDGDTASDLCIPGGKMVTPDDFVRSAHSARQSTVFAELMERWEATLPLHEQRPDTDLSRSEMLSRLRRLQEEHRMTLYRRIKVTSLFDAGLCFVYVRLREQEAEHVIRILYRRYYETTSGKAVT